MYPVLTVDDKDYKVDNIEFNSNGTIKKIGIFKEGYYINFLHVKGDIFESQMTKDSLKGEFKWLHRYTEVMQEIEKEIDEKANELTELAKLKMENEKQLPFPDKRTSELYYNKEREMIGMIHAASIIEEFID